MRALFYLQVAVAMFLLVGCSNQDAARSILQAQGYTSVVITGYAPFKCSDNDSFSTGFTAASPAGIPVTGTVCSGWLKGSTIRF
jgi:hypothetical protein